MKLPENISREIGDGQGEGSELSSLGGVYQVLGQMEKAIAYWKEALTKLHPASPEYRQVESLLQSAA